MNKRGWMVVVLEADVLHLLLEALGAIEFMIPEGKYPGDLVTLQTPTGETMPVEIPENTAPGSFLQVPPLP